ncbi:MAG: sigma 54-interacting transcriptional regulator [Verrucomicrobiaceae bacterium]|nr:sigma 54-interacting transcriptional regulator [Verrucomicrobiaceae bacterium]
MEQRYRIDGLIGQSAVMRDLSHLLETVAATSSTVLVTGETGTGKELAARAIHHSSPRRSNRFVAINCSAIPETLLEAELFGHVRGAFTGAVGTRQGRLEQAHKGTLFLDEVGTMSPALQAKLLRVLQEREFERVGDSHTVKIDVRVIAATHSDLARMVAEGTFREDLYYRLNVIPVHVPALRERRDDIPLLVQHFLQKLAAEAGRPPLTVSQDGMRRLMACHWPGNVRQLENVVERAVAFSGGRAEIELRDFGPEIQQAAAAAEAGPVSLPEDGLDFDQYIGAVELSLIKRSLERTQGNKRQAAKLLKLKRTTLIEKLKRLEPMNISMRVVGIPTSQEKLP